MAELKEMTALSHMNVEPSNWHTRKGNASKLLARMIIVATNGWSLSEDEDGLEAAAAAWGAVPLSSVGGVDYLAQLLVRPERPVVAVVRGRQDGLGARGLLKNVEQGRGICLSWVCEAPVACTWERIYVSEFQ